MIPSISHDDNDDALKALVKSPFGLSETAFQRAKKVMAATRSLSEIQRVEAILQIVVPKVKFAKPKNNPGIFYEFVARHDWLPWMDYKGRGRCGALTGHELSYYRQLFNEMRSRGGNLKAARGIVAEQYLRVSVWSGNADPKERKVRSIWFVPLKGEREAAAKKLLRFYRNRRRVLPAIANQRGPWLILSGVTRDVKTTPIDTSISKPRSGAAQRERYRRSRAALQDLGVVLRKIPATK